MYYTEKIQLNQAADLLEKCGLSLPKDVDCTIGVFDNVDGKLVAAGSIKGDMLQGIAVDPEKQGEDLTGRLMTALIADAKDAQSLYLFTKPEKAMQFTGLGFRLVAKARPYAALLEWGVDGVKQYRQQLEKVRQESGLDENAVTGALVMNCNPFTKGHRYLIETAARACDHVFILVVEEDLSRFSLLFSNRLFIFSILLLASSNFFIILEPTLIFFISDSILFFSAVANSNCFVNKSFSCLKSIYEIYIFITSGIISYIFS